MQSNRFQQKIYLFRERLALLDVDLSGFYKTETKSIKETLKNNPLRFPSGFVFRLSKEEFLLLQAQNKILHGYDKRSLPFAFTEEGCLMLSGFFYRKEQLEASVSISRAFAQVYEERGYRKWLLALRKAVFRHDAKFRDLHSAVHSLQASNPLNRAGVQELLAAFKQLQHEFF